MESRESRRAARARIREPLRQTEPHGERATTRHAGCGASTQGQRRAARPRRELVEMLRDAGAAACIDADALRDDRRRAATWSDLQVRDIMVPRSQMVVLERRLGRRQLLPAVHRVRPLALPGDRRRPRRDRRHPARQGPAALFRRGGATAASTSANCCARRSFVPESKRLNVLLKEFRVSRNHMAIVVDEYGGVVGPGHHRGRARADRRRDRRRVRRRGGPDDPPRGRPPVRGAGADAHRRIQRLLRHATSATRSTTPSAAS